MTCQLNEVRLFFCGVHVFDCVSTAVIVCVHVQNAHLHMPSVVYVCT